MTTLPTPSWEQALLSLAKEARIPSVNPQPKVTADERRLSEAYDHCTALTAHHSRSFYLATSLLPAGKRQAMRALYAFCCVSDDIVDQPAGDARQRPSATRRTLIGRSVRQLG